jgi:hypothetical protein
VESDEHIDRFRQCLLSDYMLLKAYLVTSEKEADADRCTQPASEERK